MNEYILKLCSTANTLFPRLKKKFTSENIKISPFRHRR